MLRLESVNKRIFQVWNNSDMSRFVNDDQNLLMVEEVL